jgi:hypothetical protein
VPPSHSRPVVALVLAVAAVVAGCSSAPAGPPDPFPPRPADIDIERLDPCALLGPERRVELQIGAGEPGTVQIDGTASRTCGWLSIPTGYDYSVQFIAQDAAAAAGAEGAVVGSVGGYGSVEVVARTDTYPLCEVLLDVHEGQLVRVQVQTVRRGSPGAGDRTDAACERSRAVAGYVVQAAEQLV